MKKSNKKAVYIIYQYNDFKNDFQYIKEYTSTKELADAEHLTNIKSLYNYMITSLEQPIKELLKGKYIIYKDTNI